jgi:hypothetical protein
MNRLIVALLVGAVGACAAPQALVQSTDVAAFAGASTFAIQLPPPGTTGAATPTEGARLRTAIEGEIVRVLGSKGYHPADPGAADLLVTYRLAYMGRLRLDEKEDVVAESRVALGSGEPYGTYRPLPETAQGARRELLLVTITDRKSARIIWQATNDGLATGTASAVGEVSGAARATLAKVPNSSSGRP